MLSDADIERFGRDGFVAVRGAFPREEAAYVVDLLTPQLDPSSPAPVQRITGTGDPRAVATANTPALTEAFDQLVGPGRWLAKAGIGTFPVRFPSEDDPGDAGWHADGGFGGAADGMYRLNAGSRGRALLLLMLFTDVGPDDAPTRIRVGSHRVGPAILAPHGEDGLDFLSFAMEAVPATEGCDVVAATGAAGDVFLCHPFLVHSATWPHRGSAPRWIAQPALEPLAGFDVSELGCR